MCLDCGDKRYPHKQELGAITVSMDKCPICKKRAGIVPARDWAYRAKEPGVMWD